MGQKQAIHVKKFLEIYLGSFLLRIYLFWVKHISLDSLESWGKKLGGVVFYFLGKRKEIALNNMYLALGKEKSEDEINQIFRANLRNIGRDMMEIARCKDFEDSYLKKLVCLEGKEHLDSALKNGKGAIALTAHIGNFPLMCTRLVKEGYPLSVVVRNAENQTIASLLTSIMVTIGMEPIPDKPRMTCVSRSLRALKKNRVLLLQIDQNAPRTEAWVDFFGYLVPTFKGPVVLSLRTGAPIIPLYIIRNSDHLHRITILPPFELNMTGDIEEDITLNIARLTKMTETIILEHPDQWWWFHRRFRKARDIKTGEKLFPKHPSKKLGNYK